MIHFRFATSMMLAGLFAARSARAQAFDTTSVLVHGHRIQLLRSGGVGPTVVFEAGFGTSQRTWSKLLPLLDPSLQLVVYDRPGLGASEACPGSRDALTIARELRAALRLAKIAPPYVLVGWSAGGLHTRTFAGLYPGDVRALLLIDPAPEAFYTSAEREYPEVYRRLSAVDSAGIANGSPAERAEEDGWKASLTQAQAADASWHGPVIVLSAAREDLEVLASVWHRELQAWTVRRHGKFALVARAGHAIHRDRPDTVAAVLGALVQQTTQAR